MRAGKEKNDKALSDTAQVFSSNMLRITDSLKGFLQRHEGKKLDAGAFTRDWKTITAALQARITSEEATLYPLYDKWVGAKA